MALTIYPTADYDSFITEVDATAFITNNNINSATWTALTVAEREVYLRIATSRIFNVISTDTTSTDGYLDSETYVEADSCLPNVTALMAMHDLEYGISKDINPNMGTIVKEKVGDLEVQYQADYKTKGRVSSPYPSRAISCLTTYGASLQTGGLFQAKLVRS